MNIFHAYHVQVQVSLYSFQKELCINMEHFMNIVETINKEYDKSCILFKNVL